MLAVTENLKKALGSNSKNRQGLKITETRNLALLLGALLHDADDKKLFKPGSKNTETILGKVLKEYESELKDA